MHLKYVYFVSEKNILLNFQYLSMLDVVEFLNNYIFEKIIPLKSRRILLSILLGSLLKC